MAKKAQTTRSTRSTTRRLRTNKNLVPDIKEQRSKARRKYREENGPCYTDEEAEIERPSKRQVRKKKKVVVSESGSSQEESDLELNRRDSGPLTSSSHLNKEKNNLQNITPQHGGMYHNISSIDGLKIEETVDKITNNYSSEQHFKKAIKLALLSGDFYAVKRATRYLARYLHNKDGNTEMNDMIGLHMISIGLSFRHDIIFRSVCFLRRMEKLVNVPTTTTLSREQDELQNCKQTLKSAIKMVRRDETIIHSENLNKYMKKIQSELPDDWTVLMISHRSVVDEDKGEQWPIMVSKIRGDPACQNLHLQLDSSTLPNLKAKLEQIKEYIGNTSKVKEKVQWWTMRRKIDKLIANLINDMDDFLDIFTPILLGSLANSDQRRSCNINAQEICKSFKTNPLTKDLIGDQKLTFIEVFLDGWKCHKIEKKCRIISWLLDRSCSDDIDDKTVEFICQQFNKYATNSLEEKRGHVILILDKYLHQYPWESTSYLRPYSISRVPSIDILRYMLYKKMNQQNFTQADLNNVSYVVDPKGDLKKTGNLFQNWFESIPPWRGVCSTIPDSSQWINFMEKTDVLLYCGHGGGSEFVSREEVVKSKSKACPLLMGCSSGLLNDEGISEPNGSVLSYLVAGSPCVLSYLWPVTDKDTDRYLVKCLDLWSDAGKSLTDVLRPSEKVCKMPMTNGSSCITYGLPVTCIDIPLEWNTNMPSDLK